MDENFVPNFLSLTLFFVSLFIGIRVFYLYIRSRSRRIFILSLSMGVISLTAVAGFFGGKGTTISLNRDWVNLIGQTEGFLFILLGFFKDSDGYFPKTICWHIAAPPLL